MKPPSRSLIPFALLATLAAFLVSKWRGMPFWQRFLLACVAYGCAGVLAFRHGEPYNVVWMCGIPAFLVVIVIHEIGDIFNVWRKK
jgi:hypothetical protein